MELVNIMGNAFHYQNTFDDPLAQEFRGILSVNSLQLFDPHDFWDFTDKSALTLEASAIKAIANKGRSGDAITHSTSDPITFDGSKGIGHRYANSYKAGNAGDRNFLHDGSGCEIFVIHRQEAATNEQYILFSNALAGSSYVPGMRFSTTQINGLKCYTSRVGYVSNHLFSQSPDRTLTVDMPVISHLKVAASTGYDVEMREDGMLVFRLPFNVDSVFKPDDHNAPLLTFVGYTGDIYGLLIYDRELDEATRNQVFANLRQYYGLPSIADISLLIGASNAVGIGSGSGISSPYNGIAPQSYIFAHEDGDDSKPIEWWAYEQANSHVDHPSSSGGLDLSLMHRLAETNDSKQFLIKAAIGGNELYTDWNPDAAVEFQDGLDLLTSYLTPGIEALIRWGFQPRYRGCIIGLGENDASSETKANAYAAIQARLNEVLRGLTVEELLILLVACSTEAPDDTSGRSDGNMAYQATIRSVQSQIASLEASTQLYQPITTGTLAWVEATPNGIHFDMPSLQQMGIELADLINAFHQ